MPEHYYEVVLTDSAARVLTLVVPETPTLTVVNPPLETVNIQVVTEV